MERNRFNSMEFSGAVGDLGTLIPIFIPLVAINGLNPTVALMIIGLFYIISGLYYKLPIPVQPLKAVATIAIAGGLGGSIIAAAGLLMGIILLFLSITGLSNFLSRIFSRPIIRGIQFGIGVILMRTAWSLCTKTITGSTGILHHELFFPDIIILFGGISIMLFLLWKRCFSVSFGMLGLGIIVSLLSGKADALPIPFSCTEAPNLVFPAFDDFKRAFYLLVLPQIPLTFGNAIVATKDTANKYFGIQAKRVTERALSGGMGIFNIIAGLTGGIPLCHGSGGLTSHYSFGARTGGASIIIGILCLTLSLIFGSGASAIFKLIPHYILGIMLFYVGYKHAYLITDLKDKKDILIALGIGIIAFFTRNIAIAYCFGIIFWYLLFNKKSPLVLFGKHIYCK